MKHKNHQDRKSFKKWGLRKQRFQSDTTFHQIADTASTRGAFGRPLRRLAARFFDMLAAEKIAAQLANEILDKPHNPVTA